MLQSEDFFLLFSDLSGFKKLALRTKFPQSPINYRLIVLTVISFYFK